MFLSVPSICLSIPSVSSRRMPVITYGSPTCHSAFVLTENLIVLMIVEVEDLVLLASSGRVRPYINDAEFPSCRASRQAAMQAEIIALRHQVTVLQRSQKSRRPVLTRMDRCFWVWLSRVWSAWRSA